MCAVVQFQVTHYIIDYMIIMIILMQISSGVLLLKSLSLACIFGILGYLSYNCPTIRLAKFKLLSLAKYP